MIALTCGFTPLLAGVSDFAGSNNIHPVGAAAVAIASVLILMVRRPFAPVVLLALAALIPSSQRVVVAGADFNFVRLLVLVGLVRHVARGELGWIRWNAIDIFMLIGAIAKTVCAPLLRGSSADLITAIGANFELVGAYIILRCSIRDIGEVRLLARAAAVLCVLVVPFFLLERQTGRNLFSVFGGIPEVTSIREGKIRCRGAFSHAILAGCFFVAWIPLWIPMLLGGPARDRRIALLGSAGAIMVVFACASSTPVVALLLALVVWMAFPVRAHLRPMYITAIASGVVLHFLMTKPIWHLIARIDLVGGSTGVHRYRLIDAAIRRFGEWWMFGTPTTAHWGWGLFDVTNQFVIEAIRGGLLGLISICGVLFFAYASVGTELRRLAFERFRALRGGAQAAYVQILRDECMVFGIGAAMCAQMAIFLAVSYFGQTVVIWQFLMALSGSLRQWTRDPRASRVQDAERNVLPRAPRPARRADGRLDAEPLPVMKGVAS
jgi:hypothetical protein